MHKHKITLEQVNFITQTVFEMSRSILKEPDLQDEEVNMMVTNTFFNDRDHISMFLEGYEYLMTVEKKALMVLN